MTRKPRLAIEDDIRSHEAARYEYEQTLVEGLLISFKILRPLLRRLASDGAISQELADEALARMDSIERAVLHGD